MATKQGPQLAIFASERGPGDAERSSIMSQAGTFFARRGARLTCLAEDGDLCTPLVTGFRAGGGEVRIVAAGGFVAPVALAGIPVEHCDTPDAAYLRVGTAADAFVGLPGSLVSANALYRSWTAVGGPASGKPVLLLNRHGAFEVVRGFAADILAHGVPENDRSLQIADTVEDLWTRMTRMLAAGAPRGD